MVHAKNWAKQLMSVSSVSLQRPQEEGISQASHSERGCSPRNQDNLTYLLRPSTVEKAAVLNARLTEHQGRKNISRSTEPFSSEIKDDLSVKWQLGVESGEYISTSTSILAQS